MKNKRSAPGSRFSLVLLVLVPALLVQAVERSAAHPPTQPPVKTGLSFLFLSPCLDDGLSAETAVGRLRSREHVSSRRLMHTILEQVKVRPVAIHDAIGDWSDGAENSLLVVLPPTCPVDDAYVAAAWFGLLAQQKAVLAFHPGRKGNDELCHVHLVGWSLAETRDLLDKHNIPARTILLHEEGCRVVVVCMSGRERSSMQNLAREAQARIARLPGHAEELAAPTRWQARERFTEVIRTSKTGKRLAKVP